MAQSPQPPAPSKDSAAGIQLLAMGEGMVLRIEEDGHRIQRKISHQDAWKLLGQLAGVLKQIARRSGDNADDPLKHDNVLILPNQVVGVGTNDNGNAVVAVASMIFPTVHIPLNEEQTQLLGAALTEISTLQSAGGEPH